MQGISFLLLITVVVGVVSAATLRQLADKHGLLIGSAASPSHFGDSQYTNILGQQFSVITPENEMKWGATEPQRGVFTYTDGDKIVSYAQQHNQKVRGHNLCWGESNPAWLMNGGFNGATLTSILQNHITNVASHYKGKVIAWDVVNEAVSDSPSGDNYLKHTIWYPAVPNYIDIAFQTAHQADPNAKLFYNDYSDEVLTPKSNAIYAMVKSMKQRGIPIHGVGLQYHVSPFSNPPNNPNVADVIANIKRFTDLGLEVHITEMDVSTKGAQGSQTQILNTQAVVYGNALKACLGNKNCTSFESWGFTDKYTWLGSNNEPLLYDVNYQPKPAYNTLAMILA